MQQHRRWQLPFVWLVALRFLREGKVQTGLILAGIMVGVAVVVFLSELISQLQVSMVDRVLGSQAHVVMRPQEEKSLRALPNEAATVMEPRAQRLRAIDQWQSMMQLAEEAPGVVAASPVASGPAFAIRGRANKSVAVLGIETERFLKIVKMEKYMQQGRFELSGSHTIIGKDLASDLGAAVGDKIFLRTADGRSEMLQVTGVFDIGNRDLNRRWVFTSLKLAQNLLDIAGGASTIDITVQDIFQAEAVARQLQARSGLTVESWMQNNSQLLSALQSQAASNTMIRSFVIMVVALGIASVLVVSVVQKQKEIGILRAMGASTWQMMGVFLLQGLLLGLGGAVLGIALALGLLQLLSGVAPDTIFAEVKLHNMTMLAAVAMAIAVGVLAALWPARSAARMDPVQAIKG